MQLAGASSNHSACAFPSFDLTSPMSSQTREAFQRPRSVAEQSQQLPNKLHRFVFAHTQPRIAVHHHKMIASTMRQGLKLQNIKNSVRCASSFSASDIQFTPTSNPKTMPPKEELKFGETFSDHMLQIDWTADGGEFGFFWGIEVGQLNIAPL